MATAGPYGRTIAEHFRRPRNHGPLPHAHAEAEGINPLCGDRVRLAVALGEDGEIIADARFIANACAICVASASLLTERVRGLSRDVAAAIGEDEILAALDADIPTARKRCATLPLEALRGALATLRPRATSHRSEGRPTP